MELNLKAPPTRNRITGQFIKGHQSHQTGKSWDQWIPKDKQKKILAALKKVRKGRPDIYKYTCKKTVMVYDHRIIGVFESATEASRKTGTPLSTITKYCRDEIKRPRNRFRWFYEDDPRLIAELSF